MKKYLLYILISFFTPPVLAEWTVASRNTSGVFYVYLAADGIQKTSESTVRYWQVLDLTKARTDGIRSYLALEEVDCSNKSVRTLDFASFDKSMAQGKRITTLTETSAWRYLPPGTPGLDALKVVCSFALPRHR